MDIVKRDKKSIRTSSWHEAGHTVHNLATIDRRTWEEQGHAAFSGVWVAHSVDEKAPQHGGSPDLSENEKKLGCGSSGAVLGSGAKIFCSDRDLLVNLMAGLAGERILRGTKTAGRITLLAVLTGSGNDIRRAQEFLDSRPGFAKRGFDLPNALQEAWLLLNEHKETLRRIAQELERTGFVSYERCREIWENA
jgi:hypothetical protein